MAFTSSVSHCPSGKSWYQAQVRLTYITPKKCSRQHRISWDSQVSCKWLYKGVDKSVNSWSWSHWHGVQILQATLILLLLAWTGFIHFFLFTVQAGHCLGCRLSMHFLGLGTGTSRYASWALHTPGYALIEKGCSDLILAILAFPKLFWKKLDCFVFP